MATKKKKKKINKKKYCSLETALRILSSPAVVTVASEFARELAKGARR